MSLKGGSTIQRGASSPDGTARTGWRRLGRSALLFCVASSPYFAAQAQNGGRPADGTDAAAAAGQPAADADRAGTDDAAAADTDADITVTGTKRVLDVTAAKLQAVPGTTALIDAKDVERGRSANFEDTLSFQPGVFAAATTGSTGNKISIRGSGAGSFYGGNGLAMKYLVDGITISGVVGLHEDRLNTTGYQATEVLYGANAFPYTATSLGGAINFITHTGLSAPGTTLHFEGGSFGTYKWQLSQGGTFDHGNGDYYVTAARYVRDGFQTSTHTYRDDAVANIGYQVTDKFDVRLIARWDTGVVHIGGRLTLAQVLSTPKINPNDGGQRFAPNTKMVGLKFGYRFDDNSKLEYNISYNNYPLLVSIATLTPSWWHYTDINQTLKYQRSDTLFNRPSNTSVTLSDVHLVNGSARYYTSPTFASTDNQSTWTLHQHSWYGGSRDSVLAIGNDSELLDRTWLSAGLSVISVNRNIHIDRRLVPNPNLINGNNYNAVFFAPRIGLRYEISKNLNVFTNFSRLFDPPSALQFGTGTPSVDTGTILPILKTQRSSSFEVGVKGNTGPFEGSLTLYRIGVKDELLIVVTHPATTTTAEVTAVSNASPTIHQGVEAGLTTRLFGHSADSGAIFRQAFTYTDLHYRHDSLYGTNQLPALPRWTYQAELKYENPIGFSASLDFRAASSYFVDFANTVKAPAYGIWGAKIGYDSPGKHWGTFLDFRNITNRKYVTVAYQQYNLKGADAAVFYPGDGFAVFGGATLHFK